MKMRKLSIKDYTVPIGGEDKNYQVVNSIASILFAPALELTGKLLLDHGDLVDKIEACEKDGEEFILLTEAEYGLIKSAFDTVKGYARMDIPLVQRIMEVEVVDVEVNEVGHKE